MLSAPADPQSTQPVTPSCRQIRGPCATRAAWVWMSMRPGATILPRASMVSVASPLISASTAAILPATIAMSRTASSPTDGSITRPPLMTRSYVAADTIPTQANDAADAQRNWRRFIMVLPFRTSTTGVTFTTGASGASRALRTMQEAIDALRRRGIDAKLIKSPHRVREATMRRREFMAFLGSAAAALPLTASAQQPAPPSPVRQDWLDRRREPALEPELPIVDPHHHLWVRPGWRYMLDDFLADTNSGHNIVATVFVQANSMYRDSGPVEMRPVGETEFVNGMAAICASGYCDKTKVAAGIVGYADLRLGSRAEPVLAALMRAGGDRFRGIRNGAAWDADTSLLNPANPA